MLQVIRDRAQGVFAWIIVILITIPFALWGIHQYFGGGASTTVAKVNGVDISQQQIQFAYLQRRERLQQMLGDNFDPKLFSEKRLKQQVLQQLIAREALVQAVTKAGFRVGDALLGAEIRAMPAFQEKGGFSADRYNRALQAQGMRPAMFEAQMRRDIVGSQLQAGIAASDFATKNEVDAYLRLEGQTRNIGYLELPVERFTGKVNVSDQEVSDYYDKHRDDFVSPEKMSISYVELSLGKIAEGIDVPEDQLKARYQAQKENFRSPEERRARHILIAVSPTADKKADEAARKKAQELLDKLHKGASFAELAKNYSDDPGSAKQGGDLGFFGRGVMDKSFEQAAFSLKVGELSGLVHSSFGYHIIKLEAIRGGKVKPFSEVRDELLKEARRAKAEPQFYDEADRLANLAFEHPASLKTVADELGLEIKQTDYFTRDGGKGIASNPKIVSTAYSDDVLAGNNSEPVELGTNDLVVLRVRDHVPSAHQPLKDVRDRVVSRLRQQKAEDAARAAAEKIEQRIAKGEDPKTVAGEFEVEWKRQKGVERNAGQLDAAIARAAFAMPRPKSEQKPSARTVELKSGDQAVVALYAVADPNVAKTDQAARKSRREELEQADGEAQFALLLQGVRSRAEIEVHADRL
jgi:peptidyl-prolyl cis-trans isomerase D